MPDTGHPLDCHIVKNKTIIGLKLSISDEEQCELGVKNKTIIGLKFIRIQQIRY